MYIIQYTLHIILYDALQSTVHCTVYNRPSSNIMSGSPPPLMRDISNMSLAEFQEAFDEV